MKKIVFFLDYDGTSGNGHLYRSLKFKKVFGNNSKIFFLCKKKKFLLLLKVSIFVQKILIVLLINIKKRNLILQ